MHFGITEAAFILHRWLGNLSVLNADAGFSQFGAAHSVQSVFYGCGDDDGTNASKLDETTMAIRGAVQRVEHSWSPSIPFSQACLNTKACEEITARGSWA